MKLSATLAVLAFGLALSAAPARASDHTILFEVKLADRPATCSVPPDDFGLTFDMVSPSGALLGTGQSCVRVSKDGCLEFRPWCRVTSDATFTLDFRRGSLTARMTVREVMPTATSFIQHGTGSVTSATGAYAGARGRVDGGGVLEFTETGIDSRIFYLVRLR